MTVYFSFIGDLDDPTFQWDNPPDSPSASNLPRRLVPADPLEDIGVSALWTLEQAKADPSRAKQLDWGAWGMVMTGAALVEMFGPTHRYAETIAALDPTKRYVLVAGEIW